MTLTLAQLTDPQLIAYIVIAVVSAYLAAVVTDTRSLIGFLGAFLASLVGEYLVIHVLHVLLAPDVTYRGIPIITAIGGALALSFLWTVVIGSRRHRRWV